MMEFDPNTIGTLVAPLLKLGVEFTGQFLKTKRDSVDNNRNRRCLKLLSHVVMEQTLFELINGLTRCTRSSRQTHPDPQTTRTVIAVCTMFATLTPANTRRSGGNLGSNAAGSGRDWLATVSGGSVTERHIATNGAMVGDAVGNKVWTVGKITPTGGNNITEMVNAIGLGDGNRYIEYHVAYGSLSPRCRGY